MKRFLGFVKKEFIHIFRDLRTLIILFGIPAAQIIIFGYAVRTDIKNASIAVYDLSGDEVTRDLTDRLSSSEFFILREMIDSYDKVDEIFKSSKVKAVIIFDEEFGRRLISEGSASVEIIADGSEPNVANMVTNYTRAIIAEYNQDLNKSPGEGLILIEPEVRMYYNPNLESQFMFVPGIITIVLMLICALMTSITITREKEFGTMEVLLVSPLKPIHIILGKVTPYFFLSLVDLIIILLLSWLVFGLPVKGSLLLLMLITMLYILLALSLGILISTISKTMQQAMFISLAGLMLPIIIFSGFIFPIEYMPPIYNWISTVIPARWFVTIIKNIMVKGTGITYIWKETLILSGMTILFIVVSAKRFRIRLQ
ncbi:MAG TPA: ABC transporter permease [Bacteroidales bacterium]|nr:ABC transporter permease [Bacteroidales bacterium]